MVFEDSEGVEVGGDTLAELQLAWGARTPEGNDVGVLYRWNVTASGGDEDYQYAFYVYEGETRVFTKWWGTEAYVDYRPMEPDPVGYKVRAFLRDGTGKMVWKETDPVTFTGAGDPGFTILSIDMVSAGLEENFEAAGNRPLKWDLKVSGGKTPYEYAFYVYRNGTRVHTRWWTGSAEVAYTPTATGTYHARGFVKDADKKMLWDDSAAVDVVTYAGVGWHVVNEGEGSVAKLEGGRLELSTTWDYSENPPPANGALAYYVNLSAVDYGMTVNVQTDVFGDPDAKPSLAFIVARADVDNKNAYVCASTSHGSPFYFAKITNGVYQGELANYTKPKPPGLTYTPGNYNVRFEVEGNVLRAKIWNGGDAEPEEWTMIATDDTYSEAGVGGVMVATYKDASFEWDDVKASFDDFTFSLID